VLFEDQHLTAGAREQQARHHSSRAAADDYDICGLLKFTNVTLIVGFSCDFTGFRCARGSGATLRPSRSS
jgi:hypothetical protein